jgi:hypothetical protein
MKYSVEINGMHCKGCTSLVAMSLQEQGLRDVTVDLATKSALFVSDETAPAVQTRIDHVAAELARYRFSAVREA